MPDDDVGACVGDDAKQVAAYIYDAFYSPQAHARLQPPEFDLARLTIAQYRTSVADLIGRFRPGFDKPLGAERGLKARYQGLVPGGRAGGQDASDGEEERPEKSLRPHGPAGRVLFRRREPRSGEDGDEEFSVRWEGSVFAEETGTYEFIVKSENGVRLSVNDPKNLLIDAWVSSGTEVREEKKSVFLLGGRSYPLALEFFKFKEKTASIALAMEDAARRGRDDPAGSSFARPPARDDGREDGLPADDRSVGYERGTGVSKEWDQATTEAAIEVAEHVEATSRRTHRRRRRARRTAWKAEGVCAGNSPRRRFAVR